MSDRDNITMPREVVEFVLKHLEWWSDDEPQEKEAIEALRTALAAEPTKPSEEAEALRRDAERYKWLRTRACHGPHERFVSEYGWFDVSGQHEPGFDAAIDAAMENKR